MSLAFAMTPVSHASAQAGPSYTLGIGDRYRGPDLDFTDEPTVVAVAGRAGVYYVQNADNDLYRYNNTWYMNYNGDWYRASTYNGPWVFVGYRSVPQVVYTVPTSYRRSWRDYRDVHYDWDRPDRYGGNYSAGAGTSFTLRLGDRYRGADLGFNGEPAVYPVRGRSGVYYIRDTNNDVYRFGNSWYMNYNGDWYRSSSYRGPWIFVGYRSVPRDVYTVPLQYRRTWRNYRDRHYAWREYNRDRYSSWRDNGRVRYGNVRGSTSLRIGDRYNGPDLGFYGEPRVVAVPGTSDVYYVRDSNNDIYRYGNNWFMNYDGDWYRAGSYNGPWVFVGYRSVPRDIYSVPTGYRRTWTDYRDRHYELDDNNRQ